MVNIINDYIHEYDFPVHNLFMESKEELVSIFWDKIGEYDSGNIPLDYVFSNSGIINLVKSMFVRILQDNYDIEENDDIFNRPLGMYVQNHENYLPVYHNHVNVATVNSTFYIDPPENGGEISFLVGAETINVQPLPNKIYVFPSWLYHAPLPQKSPIERVCINMGYYSKSRAVHKNSKVAW